MKNFEKLQFIGKLLFALISIWVYLIVFRNFFLLSKDMIYGDFSGERISPKPYFGFLRIPDRPNTIEHHAVDRLSADYAQVYFPSQEFSSMTKNYETGYLDPWRRPSRYAPFIHYVCSISFCKFDYGYASFLHMLTQMLLFYLFFILSFKMLKIESDLWFDLLLVNAFLFATPAGLGWFERGQFSLYVALSYLLLIMGILKNKPVLILASAFFAYVKWTSFPFVSVVFIVYLLSSKTRKEGVQSIQIALASLSTVLVLSLAFRSKFIHFVEGLYWQELYEEPTGITLVHLLSPTLIKALPLILIFLGYLYVRWSNKSFNDLIPYLVGSGVLMLTYPTVAFEYNIPNLFCFIPLVSYWTGSLGFTGKVIRYAFLLFILLISFPDYLGSYLRGNNVLLAYLAVSAAFLLIPYLFPKRFLLQPSSEENL